MVNKLTIGLTIGVSMLLISSVLRAEEKVIELEEIVVTATRMEEKISEVPANVIIISKKEIEKSHAKNIPDLLKNSTGIYVYDTSGVGSAGRINMRGFWGGMSTHKLVLIDGIPINSGKDRLVDWNLVPLNNIERIEVVKGGNSALYGDNAFACVINIITKGLPDSLQTKASVCGGSFDTREYNLSVGGGLDNLNYLINASRKQTDGYRKHCEYDDLHIDGKFGVKIDKDSKLTFSAGYHHSNRGAYPWALTEKQIAEDRRQALPGTEEDEGEKKAVNMSITYKQPYLSIVSYLRDEEGHSFGTLRKPTTEYLDDENTYGINIQSEFLHTINSFIIGAELEKNKVEYEEYKAPSKVRGELKTDKNIIRKKVGIYLQDKIGIDSVNIIPGIRYDKIHYDVVDCKANKTSNLKLSALSPKVGIVYTYNDNMNIYVNGGKSFRSPTLSQLFTNPNLIPEEGRNVEIGFKHHIENFITASLSIYQMKVDGEISYDYVEEKYKNRNKTSHKGIELEIKAKPAKNIIGEINYSYIEAKNKIGAYSGYYLTNVPKHKGSLKFDYQNNGFASGLTLTYTGSSYINEGNTKKLSNYTILDGRISYQPGEKYTVFLNIDNILDKEYYNYGFSYGTPKYNPAPGRTFKIGIEYSR